MARDIKEIIKGVDNAKLAEFAAKAAKAKSADEIAAMAAEAGTELSAEEAAGIFANMQKKAQEEVSIDDLDNIAGGCDNPCAIYMC